ncbi:penicillin-binding transpeptidase domain-containing protein [Zobellella taiwanensis]|jgi:cell division protein FtsI (penicillin-binding protein 3)|uniref:Peptidoglycan D,D-transpeptidase FtsI n=1 Tax=Zobellella taiwanensis TaxID=347535 RepID=A0A2P7QQF2_9GAMM|nr:penicillin-binding transpeptidase domain-containing protein [Zobellella taiwanensis]PSJ40170.1 peptidoglycan glycosyltransferase FtsI [Zobellella taiwanensis]
MSRRNKSKKEPMLAGWRFLTLCSVILLAFVALFARAAWIQVISPDRLRLEGDLRSLRSTAVSSTSRGMIMDRNGEELAVSVPVQAVWADPKQIHAEHSLDRQQAWQALADVLGVPHDTLLSRVQDPKRRFVYLQRQVTPAVAEYIRKLRLPGVHLRPEERRFYPTGEINAHLVGMTNIDGTGIEGIERAFNEWLTAQPGERKVRKDRMGRVIEDLGVVSEAREANNVQLTIDQRIQALAYRSLKRASEFHRVTSASLVMLDVKTGEVLAMVNTPSYNPNNRGQYQSFRARNRAVTDTYEPGSTLKPLIVVSALENGVVQADSIIDTSPGWVRLGGKRVSDTRNLGKISVQTVLQRSSNMGMVRMAMQETPEQLLDTLYRFGLGIDSGMGLVGESTGMVPQRRRWSDIEKATLSFGYGVTVTPLQLAQSYAVLANGGVRYPLTIVKRSQPPVGEQVIARQHADDVLMMLETVVGPGGTARNAAIPGYRVAGKTGTSRKAVAGGYGSDYVGVFAGMAPVSDPRLAMVVVMNEPQGEQYYGGQVAAPVFAEVMSGALQLLNIRPDAATEEQFQLAGQEAALVPHT